MYPDLITIGIATSVRTKWAIQLVLCTILIIFFVKILQKISNKYGGHFTICPLMKVTQAIL